MIERAGSLLSLAVSASVAFLGCASAGLGVERVHPVSPQSLAEWRVAGIGATQIVDDGEALKLTEGKDSKGVVLLSPESYGPNVVLRFRVRPMQHEGVCVVIVNASPVAGEGIEIPEDYDGAFGLWTAKDSAIRSYTFAFHTAYHQPDVFVTRNPGFKDLARAPDTAGGETWRSIEIGCVEGRLWLTVDGQPTLNVKDPSPLPAGRIGLRLRGPGDGSFSCLYKEVVIEELP